jgi:hypothetical protein
MPRGKLEDLTGQRFGRLTALKLVRYVGLRPYWSCQCICGKIITMRASSLKSGSFRACESLKEEQQKSRKMGYAVAHQRLRENKEKPTLCERCKERPPTEISYKNKEGHSKSWNPDDYEWLCTICHKFKDHGSGVIMTNAKIHRIRKLYNIKAATQTKLASLFKVSLTTINYIVNYKGAYQ